MGAIEHVFGVGTKFDAAGNPIERGKGNLVDEAARVAKIAADKLKVAAAKAVPQVAVSQTVAAQAAAVVAAVAAPATVSPVVAPNVIAAPPAPAATPIPPAAPVATAATPVPPAAPVTTVAEKLAGVLHNVEAAIESDVKKVEAEIASLVKDL